MESVCNKWINQVKEYMKIIAEHSMQGTEVGNILDESLNLSGKMIRAKLLLLCGLLGPNWKEKKDTLCKLAAMVELTHLASLIHDDIVDDSPYRRGNLSIQKKYGKNAAVYAGDFLMARIYHYEAKENLNDAGELLSKAVEYMCIGEISQGIYRYDADITIDQYFKNINGKTAALFETACYIGAKEGGSTENISKSLALFGKNIGFMFQIKDDILDFTSSFKTTGKEIHQDFQNGIYTFPVLATLKEQQGKNLLYPIMMENKNRPLSSYEISLVVKYVTDFGGIQKSYEKINELALINREIIQNLKNNTDISLLFSLLMKELGEPK